MFCTFTWNIQNMQIFCHCCCETNLVMLCVPMHDNWIVTDPQSTLFSRYMNHIEIIRFTEKKNCVCVCRRFHVFIHIRLYPSSLLLLPEKILLLDLFLVRFKKIQCIPGSCHQSKLESPETSSVAWLSPFTVCFFDFGSSDWHVHS